MPVPHQSEKVVVENRGETSRPRFTWRAVVKTKMQVLVILVVLIVAWLLLMYAI